MGTGGLLYKGFAMLEKKLWCLRLQGWVLGLVCLMTIGVRAEKLHNGALPGRTFLFHYAGTVEHLDRGQMARIWLPIPSTDAQQDVEIVSRDLPVEPRIGVERAYGNRLAYIETRATPDGAIKLEMVYRVTRRETVESPSKALAKSDPKFLNSNALIPINGKPLKLLAGKVLPQDQMALARVLYDVVFDHMQYRKDKPGWGRGDAAWACDSGFGNCTDFHSLFISLARGNRIPSSFEIGFSIPQRRGKGEIFGYHCWAKFEPAGHGWVPVDISEAKLNPQKRQFYFGHLDENRMAFSRGRDLILVPRQAGPPVNFLVYPYVEVNGQPCPAEQIHCHFNYEDVAQ